MLAKRLLLLSVFANGCLCGAVLIGFFRGDAGTIADDTSSVRTPEPHHEPALADAVHRDRNAARVEPSTRDTAAIGSEAPAEPGSSVADLLVRLEAAYRSRLAAASTNEPPAADQKPAPPQAAAVVTEARSREVAAPEQAAVALADTAALPRNAPRGDAHQAGALSVDAAPGLATRDDPRPRDVHIGDVHQNNLIGNVQQGDLVQVQQLAILQYFQLLALPPLAYLAPPTSTSGGTTTRHAPAFPTTLTNPDNPWGFDFATPMLAR